MHADQIIALVGPTGSGKTALSLALADRLGAEIVNCDSRQVYRGLDIGSAKPTAAERARVPHHCFDLVDPDEAFDCARYRLAARRAIDDVQGRGRGVVLVGGSGLYLKTLRYGLVEGPPRDEALRAELAALEAVEPGALHARLARLDPDAAARLHRNDHVRLIRALEVHQRSGRRLSDWQREHGFRAAEVRMRVVGLGIDRARLYARLDARCRAMIDAGLLEEIRALWSRGFGPDLAALRSIGYRELGEYLRGARDLGGALAAMQRATRQFAKRQMTWFRADPTVEWVDADAVTVDQLLAAEEEN